MNNKKQSCWVCTFCGGQVPKGRKACSHCGSDAQTGWSDDTYLDGIDLPDDSDYDEIYEKEFGSKPDEPRSGLKLPRISWLAAVGIVLLLLFVLGLLKGIL